MAIRYETLRALFLDVYYDGAVVIDKRKLLGLMGKSHDRPGAWDRLLAEWEDLGYNRNELVAAIYDRNVILAYGRGWSFEPMDKWTKE
jgi:hypothetical protein